MLVWGQSGCYIKKDWAPDRIGRAHRSPQPVTQADEFAQRVLAPPTLPDLPPPRAVSLTDNLHRLVAFFNR